VRDVWQIAAVMRPLGLPQLVTAIGTISYINVCALPLACRGSDGHTCNISQKTSAHPLTCVSDVYVIINLIPVSLCLCARQLENAAVYLVLRHASGER